VRVYPNGMGLQVVFLRMLQQCPGVCLGSFAANVCGQCGKVTKGILLLTTLYDPATHSMTDNSSIPRISFVGDGGMASAMIGGLLKQDRQQAVQRSRQWVDA
jgi:hypothetical protein